MKRMLVTYFSTIYISITLHVVISQHIWYNDNGTGDIMINEVLVTDTSTTSYYETLGWNQGGVAGGYTGKLEYINIFLVWCRKYS
jgi:hypothetical protein